MKAGVKKEIAEQDAQHIETNTNPSAAPTANSEVLVPLLTHFAEIERIQSILTEHKSTLERLEKQKSEQLAALEARITNIEADYKASRTTDSAFELVGLRAAKAAIPTLHDELFPVPALDLEALRQELYSGCCGFVQAQRDVLCRIYLWHKRETIAKLAKTLGDDAAVDLEPVAKSSPNCRRLSDLVEKCHYPLSGNFKIDLETNYRLAYERALDLTRSELQSVTSELPPTIPEPDRTIKPMIGERWESKRELPRELAPTGWTWAEEKKR